MWGAKYLPTFFCGVPYYSFSILYTKTLSVLGRAMVVCKAALAVGMIKKESSKVLPAYLPDSTLHLQKQGASRLLASLRLFALRGKARRCAWTRTSDAIVTGQNHADCSFPARSRREFYYIGTHRIWGGPVTCPRRSGRSKGWRPSMALAESLLHHLAEAISVILRDGRSKG